jgi:hypothetical protein
MPRIHRVPRHPSQADALEVSCLYDS